MLLRIAPDRSQESKAGNVFKQEMHGSRIQFASQVSLFIQWTLHGVDGCYPIATSHAVNVSHLRSTLSRYTTCMHPLEPLWLNIFLSLSNCRFGSSFPSVCSLSQCKSLLMQSSAGATPDADTDARSSSAADGGAVGCRSRSTSCLGHESSFEHTLGWLRGHPRGRRVHDRPRRCKQRPPHALRHLWWQSTLHAETHAHGTAVETCCQLLCKNHGTLLRAVRTGQVTDASDYTEGPSSHMDPVKGANCRWMHTHPVECQPALLKTKD